MTAEQIETPNACTPCERIGTFVIRFIIPAWLLAGAIFKLTEFNPNLLPPVVLDVLGTFGKALGTDPVAWLDFSIRAIIVVEVMLAAAMFFIGRIAKPVAIAVLSMFVVILVITIGQGYDNEKGIASIFSGSCGCFGSAGPPPIVMLGLDGALLLAAIFMRTRRCTCKTGVVLFTSMTLAGAILAFALHRTSAEVRVDPPLDQQAWPLAPNTLQSFYYPQFAEWPGESLKSLPFAHLLPRPLPDGFDEGEWLLVFYRADCEHCQELFLMYFSDTTLPARTLAVGIPDYDPAGALEFLCDACIVTELPSGTDYLVQTPVIVRVVDGEVVCAIDGSNDEATIEACIFGETGDQE